MDGFNKPGKLFWKPPTKTEMASLGIVRSCASDGGQKFTWVFKGGSQAQSFISRDGPPAVVDAVWKKGKTPQIINKTFVASTKAPDTAVAYGCREWKVGNSASRQRRRADCVAMLNEKGTARYEKLQRDAALGVTYGCPSKMDPMVLQDNFVCDGGLKAWASHRGESHAGTPAQGQVPRVRQVRALWQPNKQRRGVPAVPCEAEDLPNGLNGSSGPGGSVRLGVPRRVAQVVDAPAARGEAHHAEEARRGPLGETAIRPGGDGVAGGRGGPGHDRSPANWANA